MSTPGEPWVARFTAVELSFPAWSAVRPERLVVLSSESGTLQAWAWNLQTGERRRVSDEAVGVEAAFPTADGQGVAWFRDRTGNGTGLWVLAPWRGPGPPRPLAEGVPEAWSMGASMAGGVVAVATSEADGSYGIWVAREGEPAGELRRSAEPAGIGREWEITGHGLSADGELLCIWNAEDGDIDHHGLEVLDAATGEVIGAQHDPGLNLLLSAWSPVPGDMRAALAHEREGISRPAVWNLSTGDRIDLPVDLPGEVDVLGWWPDGSSLLLHHRVEGVDSLHRLDLDTRTLEALVEPGGCVSGAAVRPDGSVWMRAESSANPPKILDGEGREILATPGPPAPEGRPYRPFRLANPSGQRVHAFFVTPEGPPPYPTVMTVHGGPDWQYMDAFHPWIQALVEHGFAVGMVNYRGSTGYGVRWREALVGNIGFPETEDVVAGLNALIDLGIADPELAFIEGASWGGYVTLLAIGLEPERWRGAVAVVPVGDLVACHEDCSPSQQAYDVAIMGGGPKDLPDLYAERSPITYVERVRCPVLLIAGEHDSACPIRQVRNYAEALEKRGGEVTLRSRSSGHHANATGERIEEMQLTLDFLRARLTD